VRLIGPLLCGLLLISSGFCSSLTAQERPHIWLGLGVGSGARADGATGAAVMAEAVYQVRAHHFAIRAVGVVDPYGENADEFGEFGLLYGRAAKKSWGHASIAAGLAITGVSSCREAATSGCTTLGVPIVAEAALRFAPVLGVGAQAYANLNTKSTYGGVVLFLQLGWLP
jgi:hypothetical protein